MMRLIRQERARRAQEAERERVAHDAERIRARCQSLAAFVREAWHVLEPGSEYIHGWHIDAICAHLEAITDGRITRLLINVPPGTMKSLIVSVFWPAWEWGPRGLAWMRYLTTSYSESYVKRDSRRMRDLVQSDWYRSLWPEVSLVRSGEASFANSATGFREGVPFQSLTGGRGHRVLIDDPHSTETAESPAERQRTTRIFRESVPSRLVDPKTSAIVVIMQRLHEEDVSGQCIKLGLGYEHLMLPMEFEPERRCRTSIGFEDPRTYENELLFPERFPREVVDRDKRPMGSYAVAGQFQQRPVPREGGLFKREWFEGKFITAAPAATKWVRHWDLAATAEQDGKEVEISLPQDPGQAGKVQARDFVAMLAGYVVKAEPETGDKVTRAEPFSAQCEAGNVYIVSGDWNADYIDELCLFPGGSFKDQVDASSGAFGRLLKGRSSTTTATVSGLY